MKVIGIDIAIENLAFCGIDTENVHDIRPEEWFVLDTTPEDFVQVCRYENRKVCGKKAGWFYVIKETQEHCFYCAAHKKVVGETEEVKKWQTLNKNYLKSNDVIQSMFAKMDQHRAFWDSADYILIEKQPPKNPKMVAVMNYVYSYFVLRLWMDRDRAGASAKKLRDIVFIDAKNKVTYCLSVLAPETIEQLQQIKNKYQYFKKCSIACVQQELAAHDRLDLLGYFNSYKKIDDLADSRNMVLWWLQPSLKNKNKNKKVATKKDTNRKTKATTASAFAAAAAAAPQSN